MPKHIEDAPLLIPHFEVIIHLNNKLNRMIFAIDTVQSEAKA